MVMMPLLCHLIKDLVLQEILGYSVRSALLWDNLVSFQYSLFIKNLELLSKVVVVSFCGKVLHNLKAASQGHGVRLPFSNDFQPNWLTCFSNTGSPCIISRKILDFVPFTGLQVCLHWNRLNIVLIEDWANTGISQKTMWSSILSYARTVESFETELPFLLMNQFPANTSYVKLWPLRAQVIVWAFLQSLLIPHFDAFFTDLI